MWPQRKGGGRIDTMLKEVGWSSHGIVTAWPPGSICPHPELLTDLGLVRVADCSSDIQCSVTCWKANLTATRWDVGVPQHGTLYVSNTQLLTPGRHPSCDSWCPELSMNPGEALLTHESPEICDAPPMTGTQFSLWK